MNHLKARYQTNLALLTDLYQLTMAYGHWKTGRTEDEAVFHLFFRKNPFQGNYALACGLQDVIEFLEDFHFSTTDIAYLQGLQGNDGQTLFEPAFLDYLAQMKFCCDIDAVEEGNIVFPQEPLIRVQGPLIQAQLLETILLNSINFQTLIATQSARICQATAGDPVLEFGLRRAQGIDGGLSASRAAYIGGCQASSNVLAGKIYDIPVKGTHSHSWIMSFEDESSAFEAYAAAMPNNCLFLVDTYNSIQGVKRAIEVGKKIREKGYKFLGIRLDSGDLHQLSKAARQLLDEAAFSEAIIVASNDLDAQKVKTLKEQGSPINVWGIGTHLITAKEQPALGGVYKLAAIRKKGQAWNYKLKLSNTPYKVSNPGILQIRRYFVSNGLPFGDMIWNTANGEPFPSIQSFDGRTIVSNDRPFQELLIPIFRAGKLVYSPPTIHKIKAHAQSQIDLFKQVDFKLYPIGLEKQLNALKLSLIQQYL